MAEPLAISTSWNRARHQSEVGLLAEVHDMGFRRLEAYGHFTPAELEALLHQAPLRGIQIASFHGPCPVAPDERLRAIQGSDPLASLDETRRSIGVEALKGSIDAAKRHGVRAIVVHLGHLDIPSRQGDILRMVAEGGRGTEAHRRLLETAWKEREEAKGPYLEAALRSIHALGKHAAETGVGLGVECRDGYHEIPSLEEMGEILSACDGLPVGYWHDAGHAAKQEYAGFLEQDEYLRRYGDRLLGMHLHDFDGRLDHQAPGEGMVDFHRLAGYLRPETLVTLELNARVPASRIPPALDLLRSCGIRT